MKYLSALFSLASLAAASPLFGGSDGGQVAFTAYPGFSLDLGEMRLVEMEGQPPVWMSELEKIQAKARGLNFMDITETPDLGRLTPSRKEAQTRLVSFPKSPNATEYVKPILETLSTERMRKHLEHFTSYRTRHYLSDTGKESQQWLLSKISEITSELTSDNSPVILVSEFPHRWKQNTIIARIEGSSTTDDSVVIIGAHQDSTNMWPFGPAPGADDDGSGTVTILEAYRALLAAEFRPVRPVEFHWYSAEEGGLLGSQAVARDYAARSVNVYSMNQFDMTAWVQRGTREEVGVITDYVDEDLTRFNTKLIDEYLDIPYTLTKCGYACSDHASWMKAGYAASFSIESAFTNSNRNIHSANDRIDISDEFSFEHMLEFSKLAVAMAVELGGWTE